MQSLSHVWLFVTLGTVAHQAPLSRILQARILEWAAMSFSRGFFLPRVWTHLSCVSCTVGRFFTLWVTGGAQSRENQKIYIISPNNVKKWRIKKEHKVDGTTIKHSIRRPPQAPRNGMHSRNELTPNRPDAGWAQGKKVEASWQAAYLLHEPWLHGHAEFPRRCSCPSLSFPCQRHSFTPSSEPLPRISRITEFLKCTIYSLKHILKRSSRNPKVSSLNKNNRKKTEITMSRVKKK